MRLVTVLFLALFTIAASEAKVHHRAMRFTATATTIPGKTAKGTTTHEGIVAADPEVLPLGSRIRITKAGPYSGIYVVTDTGLKVVGRTIDIYMRDGVEAKQFGRRKVTVRVLSYGSNRKDGTETGELQ
jgi:3D (Asp-Asp-Asp) domain-containing protein